MTAPETAIQTTGIAENITYGPSTVSTSLYAKLQIGLVLRPTYIPLVSSSLRFEALTTAGTMCLRSWKWKAFLFLLTSIANWNHGTRISSLFVYYVSSTDCTLTPKAKDIFSLSWNKMDHQKQPNRNISNQAFHFYHVNLRTTLVASQSYRVNNFTEGFQLLFCFRTRTRFPSRSFFFSIVSFIKEFCKFPCKFWVRLLNYEREQTTDC